MALRGGAFIIMWHDIAPEGEDEYHHWHSQQHMPERLGHSGFLRSRRGVNWSYDRQRYFTLYEGEALKTFVSQDYSRSLNNPTEWTSSVAPHFRNFLRSACLLVRSQGSGVGGALCTFRGERPGHYDEQSFAEALAPQIEALLAHPLICGVHLGSARSEFSSGLTRETELRPPMDELGFQYVLIVETYGLRESENVLPLGQAALKAANCEAIVAQAYDMAYLLERGE